MAINIHKFTRNLLLILFVLYFAQGLLYASGTIISQASLAVIIVISGVYFVKTYLIKNNRNRFYNAWSALLLLNIIGFILTCNFDFLHVSMFKNVLVTLLTFYPFYFYAKHNLLESKHLIWFFVFMLLITIFQFYTTDKNLELMQNREDVVNNIAYMFVVLIPFVFLLKKYKLISGILLGVILFYIILGNKRGAVIVGGIGTLIYVYYQLRTIEKRNRLKSYLIIFILIAAIGYFAYHTYRSNEYLIKRMDSIAQGNSSGRNIIYYNIFHSWLNSNSIWNLFFGYGFAGSLKLSGSGHYAHNDWLELLSNFGLLGISIYFYLFFVAVKAIRNKGWDSDKRILMLAIVAMWFATTIFSMWYSTIAVSTQAMLLAYLLGNKKKSLA